jgi:hypothetical protein
VDFVIGHRFEIDNRLAAFGSEVVDCKQLLPRSPVEQIDERPSYLSLLAGLDLAAAKRFINRFGSPAEQFSEPSKHCVASLSHFRARRDLGVNGAPLGIYLVSKKLFNVCSI